MSRRWALDHPHLSLHIPSGSRLSVSTARKKNGLPRKPTKSLVSIVSNLHLLLRVPSFSRWPLTLHFFSSDVYDEWRKWSATANEPARKDLRIITDFQTTATAIAPPRVDSSSSTVTIDEVPALGALGNGIHSLSLDYEPIKNYVKKGKEVFDFEREGSCIICHMPMATGEGLYALCTNDGCEELATWLAGAGIYYGPENRTASYLPTACVQAVRARFAGAR